MRIAQTHITYFLDRLLNAEHAGLMQIILENARENITGIPVLADDWNEFERLASHEWIMYRQSRKSLETKEMAALNKERILYWREMRRRLRFFAATDPEKAVRESAERLLFVMKFYREVQSGNLWVKTLCIGWLLGEFENEEHKDDVDAVSDFRKLMDGLGRANREYDRLYNQRAGEIEKVQDLGKLVLFRKKMDKALLALLNAINIVYKYNEMDAGNPDVKQRLEKTAIEVNAIIDQLKLNLAHRGIRVVQAKKRN